MIGLPGFKKRQALNGDGERAKDLATRTQSRAKSGNDMPRYDAAALDALVQRAERASDALRSQESSLDRGDQFAAMEERIAGLERGLAAAERLASELGEIKQQASQLTAERERAGEAIAALRAEADQVTSSLGGLAGKIDAVLQLRDHFDRVEELNGQFASMNGEAGAIRSQIRDLIENISRLRTVHDDVLRAHKHATVRLDGLDQRHQNATSKMDTLERRAEAADESLDALLRLATGIPDVQHQLGVLKSTADQVAQKTAALERQRETIGRALSQESQVVSLNARLAGALRGHEEQMRMLAALEGKITEVQGLHETVLARSAEIAGQQQKLDDAERDAAGRLTSLREEMRVSTERFELENRSLDAAGERIAEFRGFVKECETRLGTLDAAVQVVTRTEGRARSLASQVEHLSEDVGRISAQAERLRVVRDDVGQLDVTLHEIAERLERVENARPMVETVVRELSTLNGSQEAIRDGLEQARLASSEMARMRELHAETGTWLGETDERVRTLRGHVDEIERARPAVEALRHEVESVNASIAVIEKRSSSLDSQHDRLATMEGTVAQLDERSTSLRSRMDSAESRFADLARQAGEAQRVATTMASVTAAVDGVERRMDTVGASINALEEHAQRLDSFGERMRVLGQELDQRQGALEKAAEHLTRASDARREAADAARALEEVSHGMIAQRADAETRAARLAEISTQLEERAAGLGDADRRITHLEDLLVRCEAAQVSASQALDQIVGRQATVDAVEAQVKRVFEVAERTSRDLRLVGSAQRDIEGARALLDEMQERLRSTGTAMSDFVERKRQVEHLEQRLARAEALSRDVRSSVELISAQRSVIDQALERSGTLAVQAKQAEGLVEALRAECTMATSLRDAIRSQREEREDVSDE
jgi:DNA repair exonuclease SbcCD ATPase subunit